MCTQQRARSLRSLITSLHSVRKLTSVYQDNRREFVAKLDLYQSAGAAGGDAPGTDSDAEEEEEDAFEHGAPPLQLALSVQQQQLALGPAPAASPASAGRGMRAPMAHLLSLVPAKRSADGAMLTTC